MTSLFPGVGTVLNVLTVLIGAGLGMAVGHRLREHTRSVVTDVPRAGDPARRRPVGDRRDRPALRDAVGAGFPVLIVLGSLLIGSIAGSLLRIEDRLEGLAGTIQAWVARRSSAEGGTDHAARERFIEGWLTASLLFCVGPLTILGALNDGLGTRHRPAGAEGGARRVRRDGLRRELRDRGPCSRRCPWLVVQGR